MSKTSILVALIALVAAFSSPAFARGARVNDAKYYGPVYGWRYFPPPAQAMEPACTWTTVRAVRNGHAVTRRVQRCS